MSTEAGVGVGVGTRSCCSTFRRFGSAFSDSSSSSLSCLRLEGEDDAGDDDESVPGAGADAIVGVGVRGRGSIVVVVVVVGAGGGVGGAGEEADEGVLSSSTTIGGGEGAVDVFLVDAATAPHVHFSMNCPRTDYQHKLDSTTRNGTYLRHFHKSSLEVYAHPPLRLIILHTYMRVISNIPHVNETIYTYIASAHFAKYAAPARLDYAPPPWSHNSTVSAAGAP